MATFFGKSRGFIDSLAIPGTGHLKIYAFIKKLYGTAENLKVASAGPQNAPSKPATRTQAAKSGTGTQRIRQRSSDPTNFDNEQYMAELEANLLKTLNI